MNSLSNAFDDGSDAFGKIQPAGEKFQDSLNDMRLMIWKRFLTGVAGNPYMTKKEICHHLGLKVGTINSIQLITNFKVRFTIISRKYAERPKRYLQSQRPWHQAKRRIFPS